MRFMCSSTTIASPMLRGRFMPLATVYLPLRESCPQRRDGRRRHHIAVGCPETDQIVGAPIRYRTQLDARLRILRDAGHAGERRADLIRGDGLLAVLDDQPERPRA